MLQAQRTALYLQEPICRELPGSPGRRLVQEEALDAPPTGWDGARTRVIVAIAVCDGRGGVRTVHRELRHRLPGYGREIG